MCIGTYEEEVYIEDIDDYISCEFDFYIDPGQPEIHSGNPDNWCPGIEPSVEILVIHVDDEYITEDEVLELVDGGEQALKKRILASILEKDV